MVVGTNLQRGVLFPKDPLRPSGALVLQGLPPAGMPVFVVSTNSPSSLAYLLIASRLTERPSAAMVKNRPSPLSPTTAVGPCVARVRSCFSR